MKLLRIALAGFVLSIGLIGLTGCGSDYIRDDKLYADDPGFRIDEEADIPDTARHREVLSVLARYRRAVVQKDFGALKRLIAEDYYDNSGTTDTTTDDYAREELDSILELMAKHAEDIKYEVKVKGVELENGRAFVDYEYEYSYQYRVGEENSWDAGLEINRLELAQRGDRWQIVSGL